MTIPEWRHTGTDTALEPYDMMDHGFFLGVAENIGRCDPNIHIFVIQTTEDVVYNMKILRSSRHFRHYELSLSSGEYTWSYFTRGLLNLSKITNIGRDYVKRYFDSSISFKISWIGSCKTFDTNCSSKTGVKRTKTFIMTINKYSYRPLAGNNYTHGSAWCSPLR